MRRRIDLYIAGQLADLSDQSFVLFNYAFADIQDPTVVKNEWSQQVTLPGTPANCAIFDHYYRPDRTTGGGWNALQKTPFVIYADTGEIVQQGYCRLDEVSRAGRIVTGYKVTLFGGLGSFFYQLSYKENGEKMTLADLDYLNAFDDNELDFTITAANVTAAWSRLQNSPVQTNQIWDVINFAPCYEGIPEGDFDADKMWVQQAGMNLPSQTGYHGGGGGAYTIVKLSRKATMWEAHDLRSYLQRPVISMRSILAAIRWWASYTDYAFDYSDIPASEYNTLWKTLPDIPSLGTFRKETGALTGTLTAHPGTAVKMADWALSGLLSYNGVIINASIGFQLLWYSSVYPTAALNFGTSKASFIFCELIAYAGATPLRNSQVLCIGPDTVTPNVFQLASNLNYHPLGVAPSYSYLGTQPIQPSTGVYQIPGNIVFNRTDTSVTRYELHVSAYACQGYFSGTTWSIGPWTGGSSSVATFYQPGSGTAIVPDGGTDLLAGTDPDVFIYSTPLAPRSGAALGKATLLKSEHTPAEYLLGWAKLQGYVFRLDTSTRTVYLERRNTFYGTGLDPIDLSKRVDRSKGVTIAPLNLQAKWYDFGTEVAQGAFAQEYASIYGRPYGWQRVNTGYDFDSAVVDLYKDNPYRGAVCKTAHGPTWRYLNGGVTPFFFEAGHKYILWSNGDNSQAEFDVPALDPTTTVFFYNSSYNGYDINDVTRPELCEEDGKAVDGEDILVEYQGTETYPRFIVSDDDTSMLQENDNRPCWQPWTGPYRTQSVPTFSRYSIMSGEVTRSLDFGTPQEVDIPEISFKDDTDLYDRAWAAYMADRLDLDTKVLRCSVDLRGLQVGPELLRRFFWWDGALWVLNKIDNYSLTTWDLAQCEFIQVRDTDNYTIGQL